MTLRDVDYYSETALNDRELAKKVQRARSRRIREELEHQYDAMLSPKKIRSILSIVAPRTAKSLG